MAQDISHSRELPLLQQNSWSYSACKAGPKEILNTAEISFYCKKGKDLFLNFMFYPPLKEPSVWLLRPWWTLVDEQQGTHVPSLITTSHFLG